MSSLLGKIFTPGALKTGKEEFVGQLIAYAGLAAVSVIIDKSAAFFFAPIPAEPSEAVVIDHEEDEVDPSSED